MLLGVGKLLARRKGIGKSSGDSGPVVGSCGVGVSMDGSTVAILLADLLSIWDVSGYVGLPKIVGWGVPFVGVG